MPDKEEKKYQYWLHNLPEVGDRTIEKLFAAFGSAKEIHRAALSEEALAQIIKKKDKIKNIIHVTKSWDLDGEYEKLQKKQISFYTMEDPEYPQKLRRLVHPPFAIYAKGNLPREEVPAVAIIGARECSQYGSCMAKAFGKAMAEAGVPVISGMARGIDGISQQAALDAGGKTWAVLGCGVDVCYPASNKKLYQEILDKGGGILSLVPPGTEPIKRLFPERNRIVAGLCDVLLVVEARQKSGTWITVDMALEQGKNVYAIPGRLTDRLSDGCNMLIRQGAGIALAPEDLLAELAVLYNRRNRAEMEPEQIKKGNAIFGQTEKEGAVKYLDFYPKSADEILEEMNGRGEEKTLPEVFMELVQACLSGEAKQVAGNYFVKMKEECF